jgi:hypothetical protein
MITTYSYSVARRLNTVYTRFQLEICPIRRDGEPAPLRAGIVDAPAILREAMRPLTHPLPNLDSTIYMGPMFDGQRIRQ